MSRLVVLTAGDATIELWLTAAGPVLCAAPEAA